MDVDGHGLRNRASPSQFFDEMWDKKKKIMYSDDTLMFRKKRLWFLLQILLVFQVIICCIQPVWSMVKENIVITGADFQALQAFKNELIDPKGFLKSWNDSGLGACGGGWEGIKCAGGQVIVIQLPWRGLGGRLTEKIGQLQALRKLSLHDNAIGGRIPSTLGSLPNLRGVHLFNNRFSGSIPYALGLCPLLQTLDFSNNSLSGTIPSILFNSTKLLKLNFSYNSLSGSIPPSIGESSSLLFVAFQHNNLSGTIPSFLGGNEKSKANASLLQVQSLRLDFNSFSGTIPPSLGSLSGLQELSFSHNSLSGFIPEDLGSLSNLKTLDLSFNDLNGSFSNRFSNLSALISLNLENNQLNGQLPQSLDKLQNLSVLSLNNNHFTGPIPETIAKVSTLTQLDLSLNNFTGEIAPSFDDLSNLSFLNVSYNSLSGPVPSGLSQKFNASSFLGNLQLCGYNGSIQCPLSPPPLSPPAPSPNEDSKKRHKLSVKDIILIVAGILLVILLLLCIILACILFPKRKKKPSENQAARTRAIAATGVGEKGTPPSASEIEAAGEIGGKLVHFDGLTVFATDDLLCATAEIMGKSTYGTVYKATLEDGSVVAVKRLREKITKGQNEFETEVNIIGKIRHPNLLALRAYYLGPKGEKLLVFDYMSKGSLATFLHARGPDTPFDWPTRMRILQGMARGLLYLHTEANVIHGNLTSSIVLLDEQMNPKISDYGLSCLMTPAANANVIATAGSLGYRAPEVSKIKKTNTKTDVYSFGVIILELLTGKSPGEAMDGLDLPQWVASIVKEEWTNEVFDLELMKDAPAIGDELLNTLKLALHCVDPSPSARPEVQEILQQLEEIRRSEVVVATSSEDVTTTADAAQLPK